VRIGSWGGRLRVAIFVAICGAVVGASAAPAWAASQPSAGTAPRVGASAASRQVTGSGKRSVAHTPAPALTPKHGKVVQAAAPSSNPHGKAEVGGVVNLGAPHPGAGRLIIPPPTAAHPPKARNFTPTQFYSSTQLDNFSAQCGFGVNETTIAQSNDNPNLLVAGANTYYDNAGNCQDSHAGVYYSSDGGQHWHFEVMPGLLFPSSGDPVVTYDPLRHVFVFAFVEFNRADDTQGRIGVEVSSDGVNWSRNTTLDSSNANDGTDKPSITVDQNPSSPHFGRVLVAWTEFFGNNALYHTAYTDDGGASWTGGDASVNQTSHECGNGTSPAFNANGEAMVVWADCTGNVNSIYAELSTDGGRTWSTGVDHQITTTTPIEGAEQNTAASCFLNNGGTAFRCNSFPSLAGDPNSADAGGTAFVVNWADVRSTTQNSQTANVSQIMSLSTTDDGTTWDHLAFMNFANFGDKFFPAASFARNGRLTVSYSSRESSSSTNNPNGKSFTEHQTEASSLTNLRAASYVTYTTDGTLGDPGSLSFIGDYAGNTSLDSNFDTFPVWTDLRSGFPSARTQDLCYSDCITFLSPDVPLSLLHAGGSDFADFYSFSMDQSTGSGADFWNVAAIRTGTDGSSIDDDTFLAPNRYYNTALASSAFGPPRNDYVVVNGNVGHAPNTAYFPQVHNFSTVGGSYSLEWDAGHIVLGAAQANSMSSSDVARVDDTFLNTGTTYFFGLRPKAGNTSQYSLTLHSASSGSYQGRSFAVLDSTESSPGTPLFVQHATGADPSQFDGVVVVNNNSGSGSYNLYRDTAAPSGTVSIDGGAQSTNSPTLHLTLSATNPTAGDPVSDMVFSVDGGNFGAWQPFSTSADLNIPATEGSHIVEVKYRNGAGVVSTPTTSSIYLVQTAPTITDVSPRAGSTAGGNTVTLTGTHFAPGATVKFSNSATSASVTFVSGTQLTAVAPPHAAGTINVIVTTPAGTSPGKNADLYAYGAPTITSVKPDAGSTAGGNTVTINGGGFVPGATVKFGSSSAASVSFGSGSQLTAVAPAHSTAVVAVSVTTPAGPTATTNSDLYGFGAPMVTSFSPGSAPTGSVVTVNGQTFVPRATVTFGGIPSPSVTFVSHAQLQAVVPDGAAPGQITVKTPAGSGSSSASFTPNLSITGLSPSFGPAGTVVTIAGVGFDGSSTVKFNGTAASSVTRVSSTQLKATAPAGGTTGPIAVANSTAPAGPVQSAIYYAYAQPTVTSFSPTSGITGTPVTVEGTNFVPGATVRFAGIASPSVAFLSTTQLKAVVPNGAITGRVAVSSPAGGNQSPGNFTPTLSVTGFSPAGGPAGTVVTINGIGFTAGSTVTFNGTSATSVTFVSSSQLKATVPSTATTGPIRVTNAAAPTGTVSSATNYTKT
jgi:hypothetical protein